MADLEQQLAQLEQKTARLKDRIKRQDTAEKVVIGGMMLAYARKSPANAKRLLDIMQSCPINLFLECSQFMKK